jgi:hypothetical protein
MYVLHSEMCVKTNYQTSNYLSDLSVTDVFLLVRCDSKTDNPDCKTV